MEKLFISATKSTPEIRFSPDENQFLIQGISSPEDVRALYYPVIAWFKRFSSAILNHNITIFSEKNPLRFNIDLSYFNSSSAKFLYDILMELRMLQSEGYPSVITWQYEESDPEMRDAGADIAEIAGMVFSFQAKAGE
ncbi:MAG TPA: DUF1987 domain-containing protein [Bacteroidales bacterium]|nr:DUF1987 domain-containing protein [Bacteroidales bacterium]